MADKRISQLPQGNITSESIFPIVSSNVTSQVSFNTIVNALEPYFSGDTQIFISGMTFNQSNYDLSINRNDGVNFTQNLGILASDMNITGGTYNPTTGTATFNNNSGGTFNVTGFLTGMTDTLVTGGTYDAGTAVFTNSTGGTFSVSGFSTAATSGPSYVRGFEGEGESGSTVTIGKGIGKITLTNGSNIFVGIDGADFLNPSIGSLDYSYEFTVILSDGTRRYLYVDTITDSTNGNFYSVYLDNQYDVEESETWINATGDYEYYPYFIPDANGKYSHAINISTQAIGYASHAEGYSTTASGNSAHAEGYNTQALGDSSHAEGNYTLASGDTSHAEGNQTTAGGQYSHAGGAYSIASGQTSFVHGYQSESNGNNTIVLGANIIGNSDNTTYVDYLNIKTLMSGTSDTVLGLNENGFVVSTKVGGDSYWTGGTAFGSIKSIYCGNTATGLYSFATGAFTTASGYASISQGQNTQAIGNQSHAEGNSTIASGDVSHAEGLTSIASGYASHAEGSQTQALGSYGSHAEGNSTVASGQNGSHSEGLNTLASGNQGSHAEGNGTTASGDNGSHAEGYQTTASGGASHAEGNQTQANGFASHAEGDSSIANSVASHAGGYNSQANGNFSFVHGYNSVVQADFSVVLGRNITGSTADTTYVDRFNIKTVSTGTSVSSLGIDASGNVIASSGSGGTGIIPINSFLIFKIGTTTPNILEVGDLVQGIVESKKIEAIYLGGDTTLLTSFNVINFIDLVTPE